MTPGSCSPHTRMFVCRLFPPAPVPCVGIATPLTSTRSTVLPSTPMPATARHRLPPCTTPAGPTPHRVHSTLSTISQLQAFWILVDHGTYEHAAGGDGTLAAVPRAFFVTFMTDIQRLFAIFSACMDACVACSPRRFVPRSAGCVLRSRLTQSSGHLRGERLRPYSAYSAALWDSVRTECVLWVSTFCSGSLRKMARLRARDSLCGVLHAASEEVMV